MGITKRGLLIMALGIPVCFLGALVRLPSFPALAFSALFLLVFVLDFALAAGKRRLQTYLLPIERLEQGRETKVGFIVRNSGKRAISLRARLCLPPSFEETFTDVKKMLLPGGEETFYLTVRPLLRGNYPAGPVAVSCAGPFNIALRRCSLPIEDSFSVFSDLTAFRSARLRARRSLLDRESAATHRMRGLGTDFSEIREYAPGDDYRKINWKATASAGKLHTNVYDVEKDLSVIAAVDTGRLMISAAGEKNRLDYAVESALALISAALHSGDRAGFVVYSQDVKTYIPPRRGKMQAGVVLNASFGLRPEYYESNLSGLASHILKKQKRRSLVVLFTYLSDSEQAKRMCADLAPLSRRHAVLVCSLQNPGLYELSQGSAHDSAGLYKKAAAAFRLEGQRSAAAILCGSGIHGFSTAPANLPLMTVNRYLEQKKRIRF